MKKIIDFSVDDKNYINIAYDDVKNNIDSTASQNNKNNIIQYSIVNNELYIKSVYLNVDTTKYNIEDLNTESIIYRYEINEDSTILYCGYEFNGIGNNETTMYRYNADNVLSDIYYHNNIDNRRFNVEYIRKDDNNITKKVYYYYIQFREKEEFLTFIEEDTTFIIDKNVLTNVFNLIREEIFEKGYFGFGYKGENNFSIYLLFE